MRRREVEWEKNPARSEDAVLNKVEGEDTQSCLYTCTHSPTYTQTPPLHPYGGGADFLRVKVGDRLSDPALGDSSLKYYW